MASALANGKKSTTAYLTGFAAKSTNAFNVSAGT
jgi:hypothetical protein